MSGSLASWYPHLLVRGTCCAPTPAPAHPPARRRPAPAGERSGRVRNSAPRERAPDSTAAGGCSPVHRGSDSRPAASDGLAALCTQRRWLHTAGRAGPEQPQSIHPSPARRCMCASATPGGAPGRRGWPPASTPQQRRGGRSRDDPGRGCRSPPARMWRYRRTVCVAESGPLRHGRVMLGRDAARRRPPASTASRRGEAAAHSQVGNADAGRVCCPPKGPPPRTLTPTITSVSPNRTRAEPVACASTPSCTCARE